MKSTHWRHGSLLLLAFALGASAALPPRQDINPALLYWQAFSQFPELTEEESMLLGADTAGDVGPEERVLAGRFDQSFKTIIRARVQKASCDWGTDPADGPNAFTPSFKNIRTAVQACVLRARVALADGRQDRMRDELLAVSVLSRHGAADSTLVGVMVQVASENKILDFISTHFDELKPAIRADLAKGLNGLPRRATVADAMNFEREIFHGWFLDQLKAFRAQGGDAQAVAQFRALLTEVFSGHHDADKITHASGGTAEGLIKYFKEAGPAYDQALAVAKAPPEKVKPATRELEVTIETSTNVLVRVAIPNIGKARTKELEFQARLARLPEAAP